MAKPRDSQRRLLRDIANLRANINTLADTPGAITHEEAIGCLLEYGRRSERILAQKERATERTSKGEGGDA
jgi:hypothetical protein